ncbi:MAG TPA: DNA-formamidopyrimidine glycosylase family protein [Candidatus Saccharimonadales bacterium]|nr:DNA-formamidopyrimidine glycosylase family protein [Candidatus Saccharimonadales bacterium]
MPELPEVETIRIGLSRLLPGLKIKTVEHDWPKSFPNAPADVARFLVGAEVVGVRRRAKVLIIDLSSQYSLIIHLKMTGQLVFVGQQRFGAGHPNADLVNDLPAKSTRVIITFEPRKAEITDGLEPSARKRRSAEQIVQKVRSVSTGVADEAIGQERGRSFGLRPKVGPHGPQLFFNDQRKFGWMRLMPTIEIPEIDFFKKVGPEPLEDDFTVDMFIERIMRRKNSNIKAVLLDQTVLAGVGNIYADESLWLAKIHPATIVSQIPKTKLMALYNGLLQVLRLSIEKGGSTDKNYVDAEGNKGSYLSFANVFRKEGQPCPRCGTIIEKTRVAGRGTHFCPHDQILP